MTDFLPDFLENLNHIYDCINKRLDTYRNMLAQGSEETPEEQAAKQDTVTLTTEMPETQPATQKPVADVDAAPETPE